MGEDLSAPANSSPDSPLHGSFPDPLSFDEVTAESPAVPAAPPELPAAGDGAAGAAKDEAKDVLVLGRRRVIVFTAGVAVVSLVVGLVVAGQITSPDEQAARSEAPEASLITAAVELRGLQSNVVTRGDVVYDGSAGVVLETSGRDTPAIVTGRLPAVGDSVEAGGVLLEVSGRPVLVLAGEVPVFRSLHPGMSGPDVVQLKTALAGVGLSAGDPANDTYDQQTADAVAALYDRVGYRPPRPDETLAGDLQSAEEDVTSAEDALDEAQAALSQAGRGPTPAEQAEANGNVTAAQQELTAAQAEGDQARITSAQVALDIAVAQRDQLFAGPDTSIEAAAVSRAQSRLSTAETALAAARIEAGTPLPAGEVVFLPNLPRRVDVVSVARGRVVQGEPVVQLSGTDLVVVASLRPVDVPLVAEGMAVQVQAAGIGDLAGTIRTIRDPAAPAAAPGGGGTTTTTAPGSGGGTAGGGARTREAVIVLTGLTEDQIAAVRGSNVLVTIPVEATAGEVLAVPLAAVTMGPGGESRVEIERADGETELVDVEVGLSAQGFAEIRPRDAELHEGDQVVVGR